jgi:hypothetical protein
MALVLHGITLAEANHPGTGGAAGAVPADRATGAYSPLHTPIAQLPITTLVPFRDLCAVVSEQKAFVLDEPTPQAIAEHRAVVDSVFRHAVVLPAPVGVVFRAADVLKRWMELHYVSLTDAIEFVEDRAVARVHILRADGRPDEVEAGSDLAAAATEALRALRRRAVASVPLRLEAVTGLALSAAFLVDRELWKEFMGGVAEQRDAHNRLRFDVTGPWAPFDFVRMQFGG